MTRPKYFITSDDYCKETLQLPQLSFHLLCYLHIDGFRKILERISSVSAWKTCFRFLFFSWIGRLSVKCKSYELKHKNALIKMFTHPALAFSHLLLLLWVVGTLSSPLPAHSLGFCGTRDLEAPLWPHDRYPGLQKLPNSPWFFPRSLAWDTRAPMLLPTWALDFLTHLSVSLSTWLPWPARGCPPLPTPQSRLLKSYWFPESLLNAFFCTPTMMPRHILHTNSFSPELPRRFCYMFSPSCHISTSTSNLYLYFCLHLYLHICIYTVCI